MDSVEVACRQNRRRAWTLIPISPDNYMQFEFICPMAPSEWAQMMRVLDAFRRGIVDETLDDDAPDAPPSPPR